MLNWLWHVRRCLSYYPSEDGDGGYRAMKEARMANIK